MNDKELFGFVNKPFEQGFENTAGLREQVRKAVEAVEIYDIHTHLFPPQFGSLNLWGIDELLNYHYLIAEFFRFSKVKPDEFNKLEKVQRSDLIWQTLFVENTPVSEAATGVITILSALGLNSGAENLREAREFFAAQKPEAYLDSVLKIAGVSDVVMTNDPLDEAEISYWKDGAKTDARFHAALRLDRLLNDWSNAVRLIEKQGYCVSSDLDEKTTSELRRFFDNWTRLMNPLYLAASLPDDFAYPENSARGSILQKVILPFCRENKIPLSLMIGVRRKVNSALGLAGDGVGRADVSVLARICAENPEANFLATFLSLENQHELCVTARKFSNLVPFGCWWFLNTPSIISEITKQRFELLGTSFIAQHSDARILDQLIYKWKHSRRAVSEALTASYENLFRAGRKVTEAEIVRDVKKLFAGNFQSLIKEKLDN